MISYNHIFTGETTLSALKYIVSILFVNRLGLKDLFITQSDQGFIFIEIPDAQGKLVLPPFLSSEGIENLLRNNSLSLQMAETDNHIQSITGEKTIPVLAEKRANTMYSQIMVKPEKIECDFDILGSAFYILTRAEEIANPTRDEHGRFSASASHAYQNGYLHRPIVDEYVEILWWCMKRLWPRLERKPREFRILLSHDVDNPFAEAFLSLPRIMRSCGGDIIKRKDPKRAFNRIANWMATHRGNFRKDTNYTFDRIMDLSEKHGYQSAFYFKTACTNPQFDNNYSIDHPYLRQLLCDIYARGHEIGFHPSYETYKDLAQTKIEFNKLLQVCDKEGIKQSSWGGRQHYLRWEAPTTWRNWVEAGLSYDSTLSYADCAGFRCGTCHEFPVFDIEQGRQLPLIERPLIVMEGSLFGKQYMGLNHAEAFDYIKMLKDKCRRYKGNFTLLWHNSSFTTKQDWDFYRQILPS